MVQNHIQTLIIDVFLIWYLFDCSTFLILPSNFLLQFLVFHAILWQQEIDIYFSGVLCNFSIFCWKKVQHFAKFINVAVSFIFVFTTEEIFWVHIWRKFCIRYFRVCNEVINTTFIAFLWWTQWIVKEYGVRGMNNRMALFLHFIIPINLPRCTELQVSSEYK